jgi:hypothetical protein
MERWVHLYSRLTGWTLTLANPQAAKGLEQHREYQSLELDDALDRASEFLRKND